ncbi:myosin-like coiled-coil protein-domain-containing protein [Pseudomassariella vexata]|uniref:Myosin-like coiled-coil protein-domain-containing protein n=1 Tax=Pseudomassariella vexata TaxID=1141098 RepID=A0A1Y2EJ99_9PEZI|nr:myosin-like coiled-coil protein-domain-containing protein [Pseudomassariella vexata]ORY71653.1 myosin-like coiled-coil protein-domain-containing protein [Pseudomassariella vexata]
MNDMEKIDLLTKRWSELFTNMKRLERDNIKNKKRADQLQKDKDTSRTEVSKQTGLKEKLEKLCRELQKENNKLKNEQRTLRDAHEKLRKDSDSRFESVLKTLEGYQEEKDNPRKQVMNTKVEDLFKNRFKSLIEQYELRELHFHSQMRTKEIEVQWNMARYEQQKKAAETETARSRQLNSQVLTFSKTETELRNQLNVYVDKFKQENDSLKRKQEALNQNIFKMADERTKNMKDLEETRKKSEKLTSIINAMQAQGRGIPQGMQGTVENCYAEGDAANGDEHEEGEEESDYEYGDDEGDEDASEEGAGYLPWRQWPEAYLDRCHLPDIWRGTAVIVRDILAGLCRFMIRGCYFRPPLH